MHGNLDLQVWFYTKMLNIGFPKAALCKFSGMFGDLQTSLVEMCNCTQPVEEHFGQDPLPQADES